MVAWCHVHDCSPPPPSPLPPSPAPPPPPPALPPLPDGLLLNRLAPQADAWPPAGSALRGTTLGDHLAAGPDVFFREYAFPAHILRTFRQVKAPSMSESNRIEGMELKEHERLHIARGGYLWYNLKCPNVQRCVDRRHDDQLRAAAAAVRGVAPAHVLVCVNHEWDQHLGDAPPDVQGRCPAPGKDDCSSGQNLRSLYGHVQRLFDEAGAANAVWVVDYSTKSDSTNAVAETWPVHRRGYANAAHHEARVDVRAAPSPTCPAPTPTPRVCLACARVADGLFQRLPPAVSHGLGGARA